MRRVTTPAGGSGLDPRRSIVLRWWLIAATGIAVLAAPTLLDLPLPLLPMLAVLAALAVFNGWLQHGAASRQLIPEREFVGHLCVDLVALAVLLYLSGGAANPLISLLLVPVTVAALTLSGLHTAVLTMLAIAAYSLLTWLYLPLAIADAARAAKLHLAGMWLTFVASALMIAWFVARMTASVRERDRRLAEAREQALRDERVVALGALAAGAAHELGTPLATIAVLVGELERDPSLDADAHADLSQIRQQVGLCKEIISGLTARGGVPRPGAAALTDAGEWLRAAVARWQAMRPLANVRVTTPSAALSVRADAALEQAVASLLNNAADATDGEVAVALRQAPGGLAIEIDDSGPGFPPDVLARGGREALAAAHGGAGIGLMLAFAAVERHGGRITLRNPAGGGACARIELPFAAEERPSP
jgi:two-component system sensor histidine kinase RegB